MLPFNFHDHVKAGFLLAFMLFLCYNNARVNFVESPETLDIQGFLKIFGFYLTQADDLGRVVIPKEIRRTMRIREGDPLEIYTDADGEVIFKKYSQVGELSSLTAQYAEVLHKNTGLPVVITDRDRVISCAGVPKKETVERRITQALENIMENRSPFICEEGGERFHPIEGVERDAAAAFPIIGAGDVSGAVVLLTADEASVPTQTEIKLVQVAASFLGKQMEE